MIEELSAPTTESSMTAGSSVEKRDRLFTYVVDHLVGPAEGENEQLSQDPSTTYVSGVLFPKSVPKDETVEGNDATKFSDELSPSEAYELAVHATKIRPSSMGLSVVVPAISDDIDIVVSYAIYIKMAGQFARQPLEYAIPLISVLQGPKNVADWATPDGLACVRLIRQPHKQGFRLTCFVVNDTEGKNETKLYQCAIHITLGNSSAFIPVDNPDIGPSHIDDRILRLQYRNIRPFANAFGCSADWERQTPCRKVWSSFVPREEVAPLTFEIPGLDKVLGQAFLSTAFADDPKSVIAELAAFSNNYKNWVDSFLILRPEFQDGEAFDEVVRRCNQAVTRINAGIELLEKDEEVRTAFIWANLAMLIQAAQYKGIRAPKIDCDITKYFSDLQNIKWRPFQLAFLLLNLEPIANPDSTFRSVIDLIWFPTGGARQRPTLVWLRLRSSFDD
jgi:hypothetical protein